MRNIVPEHVISRLPVSASQYIHVAAAAIVDGTGRVFITRRHDHVHQGGLWEFPGGKLEPGESVNQALSRELFEEVGIWVRAARPLIRIHHDYPDKSVLLDVWRITAFDGEAHGKEGQESTWVQPARLFDYQFPAANRPIVNAVSLPHEYFITPEPDTNLAKYLSMLKQVLESGVKLVQFRAKSLKIDAYASLATKLISLCHEYGAELLLNASPMLAHEVGADGVHLDSKSLMELDKRPVHDGLWLGASCHSPQELKQAEMVGVDFAVYGPVQKTLSHPEALPLGWEQFSEVVDVAALPVYALGGLSREDKDIAFSYGAQGIAAIRTFL